MGKETGKRSTKRVRDRTETYFWVTKLAHIPLYEEGAYPVLHHFAEQHNVKVVIAGPEDSATKPYVQAVYDAIQQGAAGIMVSGWGDEEIIPAVDAAVESGIPVVSVDGDIIGSKRLAHVGTDWFRMGIAMADKLVDLIGTRGRILMMGLAGLANIQAGFHGFQHRMAASPLFRVLGPENDLDVGFGRAEDIVTAYLKKYPNLSGVAGFGINSGPGAAKALEKAGMTDKVKLICTDTTEPHLRYLKEGVIDATFAQKRKTFTYLAFKMVYEYNHGSLNNGYRPGPVNITGSIDTGHIIVTRDEVETFESKLNIEEPFVQQQLSRQVALFSSMIENSAELALATDAGGYIIYANPACLRLRGVAEGQILNFLWEEIFDLTDENREEVARCMAQAHSTSIETSFRKEDGSALPVQLSVSPMTTDTTTGGMVLIATDISERKQAEQALAYERDLLQTLMDNVPDWIFFKDAESRIVKTNKAHARLLGFDDPQDVVGKMDFDLFPPRDAKRFYDEEQEMLRSGEPVIARLGQTPSDDGEVFWVSETKIPLKDEKGRVMGLVGISRDVTDIKRAEETLKEAHVKIEKQAEEGAVDLKREVAERKRPEGEFQSVKDAAEEANRSRCEFLANMSHDMRIPINGVFGMCNLLLNTELDAEQADYVETGKRSADSLLTILNDILDYSKILAGKLDLESLDFDLRAAMEEVVALPAMQAHDKGLEFSCQIHHDIPSLLVGDPGRLRRILLQLAGNAIKSTSKGDIAVTVSLEEETGTEIKVRFAVKDTGIGISQADQDLLFESFHPADAFTTRQYGGIRLGLAISKRLTALMGGEMGVESEAGKGSTFWFTAVFEKQPFSGEKESVFPDVIRGKRLLLVDDNKTSLEILKSDIEAWGCSCDTAQSGEVALSLMNVVAKVGAPYDLVITDMHMPEMDGEALGRMIQRDPILKDTLMMMLTFQGFRGDAVRMKDIGFAAYLSKPIRRSQLLDCLAMVFGKSPHPEGEKPKLITRYSLTEAKRRGMRVLVAEDSIVNQELALLLVKKFGFRADAVVNGREAVHALQTAPYDLVLMDVQMPETDGFEAARIIRDSKSAVRDHTIPIIALTGHVTKEEKDRCLEAGMDDCVSKPIDPQELAKAMEKQISKKVSADG